jgi:hypothetical protein
MRLCYDRINLIFDINLLAERFVKLSLQIGQHCPYYVDVYYGPNEWKPPSEIVSLAIIFEQTELLVQAIQCLPVQISESLNHRVAFLLIQVKSSRFYINRLRGKALVLMMNTLSYTMPNFLIMTLLTLTKY